MAKTSQTAFLLANSGVTETNAYKQELDRIQRRLLADPGDGDALGRAGTLLYEMGRFPEAIAHLKKLLSTHRCPLCKAGRTHYRVFMQLADCYAALNDFQLSEQYYQTAVDLAPARADAYLGLGTLAMRKEQFDRASKFFQIAGDFQPDCSEAFAGLAMIHHQGAEYAEAFEMYLKCLELDTDNLVALLGLFQTSCEMGNFSQIIYYLEIYLSIHQDDTSVLFCLASLYAKEGRLSDARQATMKVLAMEPHKPEAVKLLAELKDGQTETGHRSGAGT